MTSGQYERELLSQLEQATAHGWGYVVAARLGELAQAEQAGVIGSRWRQRPEAYSGAERSVGGEAERRFELDLAKLRQVVNYGGKVGYEEMVLILSLRSELEFAIDFMHPPLSRIAADVEDALSSILQGNANLHQQCAAAMGFGFWKRLPRHWWCRPLQDHQEPEE